jgi:hypothetical protein
MPHIITIGELQHCYLRQQMNFVCFSAEHIIEEFLDDGTLVEVNSIKFWSELHRIDPEMFTAPPDDAGPEEILLEGWISDEFANQHEFIRHHRDNEKGMMSMVRPFRIKVLELLVERHGAHTALTFEYKDHSMDV